MVCDFEIHDTFKKLGNIVCPFCDKQWQEWVVKNEPRCVMIREENVDGACLWEL